MTYVMRNAGDVFDHSAAPMRIGKVRLKVRDLARVAGFYRDVLGLRQINTGDGRVTLGAQGAPLLDLIGDPALAPNDPRTAGLFHTAFLLPTRADLGRWLAFAMENRIRVSGASDHIVSEALYLSDPEGNGIEIYADRPPSRWLTPTGTVQMATDPLDVEGVLAAAAGTRWKGFPDQGIIGHVHLQVGDTLAAEQFYRDVLGFTLATRYPGASFLGSGGYHHQLAGNIWHSRNAGPRPSGTAGLDAVEVVVRDAADHARILDRAQAAGLGAKVAGRAATLHDPWGTAITLLQQE